MICYSGIDNQSNAQTKNLNTTSPNISSSLSNYKILASLKYCLNPSTFLHPFHPYLVANTTISFLNQGSIFLPGLLPPVWPPFPVLHHSAARADHVTPGKL